MSYLYTRKPKGVKAKRMVNINIKALSINQAFQGRRFKTNKYKSYEKEMLYKLPNIDIPEPPYSVYYEFGFSSSLSDIDNGVKPLQDILQKKYGFNDREVFHMEVTKTIVKKGEEYIKFEIKKMKL